MQDSAFIREAAKRGIFAYITDGHDPEELQSSIDIVLRRFAEYHDLEGSVRASRRDGACQGHPDGAPTRSMSERRSTCCVTTPAARNRKMVDVAEEIVSTAPVVCRAAGSTERTPSRRTRRASQSLRGSESSAMRAGSPGSFATIAYRSCEATRRSISGFSWSRRDEEPQAVGAHGFVLGAREAHDASALTRRCTRTDTRP